ncbi:zinc dependent phospholipase C family protein [bacterium]|nr:zinc dependent phospholipase C family protein [candidate division CSSED10-310 bacterium]
MRRFLIVIQLVVATPVMACGISTHQEICERTIAMFDPAQEPLLYNLAQAFPGAMDSGAVFPDMFWLLDFIAGGEGDFREMGELVHDGYESTFGDHVMAWLRLMAGPPYTYADQQVIAFCFGSFSHSAADAVFHPGFLPPADTFDGADETAVEIGLDMFCMFEQGEMYDRVEWCVPASFMSRVIDECGYFVHPLELYLSTIAMKIGIEAEKWVAPLGFSIFEAALPWCHDNYEDYPEGGLDHCATYSATHIRSAWAELETGEFRFYGSNGSSPASREEAAVAIGMLGLELLADGIVDVPVREDVNGNLRVSAPIVLDPARLALRLMPH